MKKALRPEKDCLNCGARVEERFCPACGQENIPARESFGHLVTHFVFDLFHFDGKFFDTLKFLLFKPGFLSQEHLKGRRMAYLHPIRLYLFTSAFYFLVFFTFYNVDEVINISPADAPTTSGFLERHNETKKELIKARAIATKIGQTPVVDSLDRQIQRLAEDSLLLRKDSVAAFKKSKLFNNDGRNKVFNFGGDTTDYTSEAAYDSLQQKLPPAQRSNWLVRQLVKRNIHLQQQFKGDDRALLKAVSNKFLHLLPQTFFTSLPLFALLLQLLYVRRRKQYFYVDHLVYTIHVYCATFILVLLSMWLGTLLSYLPLKLDGLVGFLLFLLVMVYGYKAQRHFYGQSRTKTLLKFFGLLFLFMWVMVFVFVVFFLGSALTV